MDPLARDALAWILRLKSGDATAADAERLLDWRATSPAHETAFRDAVKCWQAIGPALEGASPMLSRPTRRTPGPKAKSKPRA